MNKFIEIPASKISLSKRKLIYGVGINDAKYMVEFGGSKCPYYQRWINILERCYCHKHHKKQPTYKECSIDQEWVRFSVFSSWMKCQEWANKHLDKDLLYPGNKIYSSRTCIFIPQTLNNLLTARGRLRGKYPQGVHLHTASRRFRARCMVDGKSKHLGLFDTPSEASKAYNEFKSKHIKEVAQQYKSNEKLYDGLMSHAKAIVENAA